MAYLQPTSRTFVAPVDLATARKLIDQFCAEAFPGSKPSKSTWNGRVSVSLSLGEGAYASVAFDSRDLQPQERNAGTPQTAAFVTVSGTVSGVRVAADAKSRAQVQRFLDGVAASLQRGLDDFSARGFFRPSVRFSMPDFPSQDRGIA